MRKASLKKREVEDFQKDPEREHDAEEIVFERKIQPETLLAILRLQPLDDIWVTANLKETEIKDVNPGDPVEIRVDSYPGRAFRGHVESVSPATGAKFSLLPPDNATGNFTKVVQRIPVRIRLDDGQDPRHTLRPGMSAKIAVRAR